ncbi:hypothetical protein GQ464_009375 [Rhodocaloribacter litoris]|uniref:hypothetical protein n=1 Tax=Rhodocaloribacter litoris TaxID=2558931 RepID=UPI001E51C088|nr:hypothetical protein [Rhodocaloribacter litoris]QXD13690.1 hypothetical protein GQ464_009375 [Rhodocaloribacter litoris]
MNTTNNLIDELFNRFPDIRYVAIYKGNELHMRQRQCIPNASSSESDKYEELWVNPTLLTLARQRGNIDCGGLRFLIVAYGHFYQLISEIEAGHISICLEQNVELKQVCDSIFNFIKGKI